MKTDYPYYVAVKIDAGKLVKIYKDKKYKMGNKLYFLFFLGYNKLNIYFCQSGGAEVE